MALILHCVACSLNATRPMRESEIAVIDEKALRLPLDGSMFKSLAPERGVGAPWPPGTKWNEMVCPRHSRPVGDGRRGSPWALTPKEAMAAAKLGGPWRLFTNEGWIRVNKNGIVSRPKAPEGPEQEAEELILGSRPKLDVVDEKYGGPPKDTVLFVNQKNIEIQEPDKPFKCPICGRGFISIKGVNGHIKVHQNLKYKKRRKRGQSNG